MTHWIYSINFAPSSKRTSRIEGRPYMKYSTPLSQKNTIFITLFFFFLIYFNFKTWNKSSACLVYFLSVYVNPTKSGIELIKYFLCSWQWVIFSWRRILSEKIICWYANLFGIYALGISCKCLTGELACTSRYGFVL